MADTTNINDLPGPNNQQANHVVQQMQQQMQPQMQQQTQQQMQHSHQQPLQQQQQQQNVTMDVTYNPNNVPVQGTTNPQLQQNNSPQLQNQQMSQPNMTYGDVVKSLDNKAPETVQMNNGNTMSNILQNMEQLAKSGAFQLPSRDIPRQENIIDSQSRVNYIPEANNYIDEYESQQEIDNHHRQTENKKQSLEVLYDKLQVPLIIGLLYFVFHLPIVNKWFLTTCSYCFHKDGNMNFNGYVMKSSIFASLYFGVNFILDTLNN